VRLVFAEYLLLLAISVCFWLFSAIREVNIFLLIAVVSALALTWYRSAKKPDEDWYQFRALAESVKTLAWRYAMRADPFDEEDHLARATLRNRLKELIKVNSILGARLESHSADGDQITDDMESARGAPLTDRLKIYGSDRIHDQRSWYAKKAATNKKASEKWFVAMVVVYTALFIVLAHRLAYSDLLWLSPDPLLVVSASIVGWIQTKRFNDLAAAYLLTAQEIGIVATEMVDIANEASFSKFVNNAELVFSREHTQWVARRRS
jgi:hypothetical protein